LFPNEITLEQSDVNNENNTVVLSDIIQPRTESAIDKTETQ
jgi:hypothetical protein